MPHVRLEAAAVGTSADSNEPALPFEVMKKTPMSDAETSAVMRP